MTEAGPPESNGPPTIVCRDVWKIFGRAPERVLQTVTAEQSSTYILEQSGHVVAVRGVSFEVGKGETFVVMGLSGSGKSTLVRCISRLTEPTRGQILVDGQDVLKMDEAELRELRRHKISMVFQNFGLFPHRRVIDNVAYGLEVRGVPKVERQEQAAQMIELVGLQGWFAEALKLGDRIAIMRHGQFVQVGTPQELVLNPKNAYVNAFVKDAPRAKVLTAAAIMTPGAPASNGQPHPTAPADASLDALMPLVAACDEPVMVIDGAGAVLGYVDRAALIKALIQPKV